MSWKCSKIAAGTKVDSDEKIAFAVNSVDKEEKKISDTRELVILTLEALSYE